MEINKKISRINELKKIIQKTNPEIMELVFGCEIEFLIDKIDDRTGYKGIYKYLINNNCYSSFQVGNKKTGCLVINKSSSRDFKILGRPITLEDVLVAISKVKVKKIEGIEMRGEDISVSADGFFVGKDEMAFGASGDTSWQLNKSLSEQSEETINFLYDLLKTI